jgi:hypothetical protein
MGFLSKQVMWKKPAPMMFFQYSGTQIIISLPQNQYGLSYSIWIPDRKFVVIPSFQVPGYSYRRHGKGSAW